ncbi:GIY-YIG nuclease family protein [Blastococcus xanthinilyticus]|uniref:GIY-YIG catalytic domain-containing protein n=1 Tax=Blastococcus xanthinilyticus TaxID=1564164 RepID=A0A5S5D0A1_9ACTN|nr:GIY-YIG nuclease family protein [Blastococcus xanthinilyticus]TYP88546.1 hypothetical protein BD833_104254 [Blastococcus xanthinilyticus]
MTDAAAVARELCGPPTSAADTPTTVPRESGLYAWWAAPGTLPEVSGPAHPTAGGLELIYIGLAQDLRSRVAGNHLRGPTGSSTLRRALVALLMPSEGYTTRWTTDRVVPVDADELRVSEWMQAHLRVTWATHPDPKAVEGEVIAQLAPPLNQLHNKTHPSYRTIKAARAAYRASAGPRPQRTG